MLETIPVKKRRTFIPLLIFVLAFLAAWIGKGIRYSELHSLYIWVMFACYILHFASLITSFIYSLEVVAETKENRLPLFPWLFISILPVLFYSTIIFIAFVR